MLRVAAVIAIAASLSPVTYAQTSPLQAAAAAPAPVTRWASLAQIDRMAPQALRWDDPRAQAQSQAPVASDRNSGRRSKGRIALGLGLIGGGVALMIANPDVSETGITSNGQLYRKSYRVRLAGGIIAGGGGVVLWSGMRKK